VTAQGFGGPSEAILYPRRAGAARAGGAVVVLRAAVRFARRKPLGAFGAIVLVVMVLMALFAGVIAPYDPVRSSEALLQGPSRAHVFGTDHLGRDMFSRIAWGAKPSLYTGLLVVTFSVTIGLLIGVSSGFWGGAYDLFVQRIVDGLMAIPGLVLAMAVVAVMGNRVWLSIPMSVVVALTVVMTPVTARVVRGAAIATRGNTYVEAARVLGCSERRIVFRHVVPNIMAPVIVVASIQLGGVILAESSLSFLGLGTPPPTPSWGAMLSGQGSRFFEIAPWLAIFPGIALSLAVLAFNLLGDALRDVLDPRLRGT
jgi:peptide/nickel transport system permease protein